MKDTLNLTKMLLKDLVSFPIISGDSNLSIIEYIINYLSEYNIQSQLSYDHTRQKANLFATIGPHISGGVVLSGHSDVVPVEGQNWTHSPFDLIEREGRLYGRGSVDMKGYIACALAQVPDLVKLELKRPFHFAITYDEETGSYGAKVLAEQMKNLSFKPAYAIVGEPTQMQVIVAHKGGYEIITRIRGVEGHSSNPDRGVSAIHYAVKFINYLLEVREQLAADMVPDSRFEPPYTSINIGTINGGTSRNTIAGECVFDWELRLMPNDDGEQIMTQIEQFTQIHLLPQMRRNFHDASITTKVGAAYQGLAYKPGSSIMKFMNQLTGSSEFDVVSFGTDAGYFQHSGLQTVVHGPGSIEQAHKPDEYIEISQLQAGLEFMNKLKIWAQKTE